jgi:hypothetical protein
MTNELSHEAVAYIAEWYETGNRKRESQFNLDAPLWAELHESNALEEHEVRLSQAGITIAKQAIEIRELRAALEQACEVAR